MARRRYKRDTSGQFSSSGSTATGAKSVGKQKARAARATRKAALDTAKQAASQGGSSQAKAQLNSVSSRAAATSRSSRSSRSRTAVKGGRDSRGAQQAELRRAVAKRQKALRDARKRARRR